MENTLNSFTEESIRRAEGLKNQSKSIHPFGRKGTNMSATKRPTTIARVMKSLEGHLERHPNDSVSRGYHTKLSKL